MVANYNPGSMDRFTLILANFDSSKTIDISPLVINMSITEDIFKNTMYGSVIIKDALGLLEGGISNPNINAFPIIGEEFLNLTYKPRDQDTINVRFFVYSVGDVVFSKTNRFKQYELHFCSEEHLIDATTIVQKGYQGLNSDTVQSVLKDYLMIDKKDSPYTGKRRKVIDKIQPTKGQQNIVFPRLTPLQCAQFLARRSIAAEKYQSGTYLFFENMKGFNFCDVEYLIDKGVTKFNSFGTYSSSTDYHPMLYRFEDPVVAQATSSNPTKREMNTVMRLHQKSYFDTIEKLKRGMIESDVIVIDLINDTETPTRFRFLNNSDKTNTSEIMLSNENNKAYPMNSSSFLSFCTSTTDADAKYSRYFVVPKDMSIGDSYTDQIYPARSSYFTGLSQDMFTIDTFGNTAVNAGDVIYLVIPSGVDQTPNKLISGYYLVGTIRHILTQTYYHTKMDLYKNAYNMAITPTTTSANTTVTPSSIQSSS